MSCFSSLLRIMTLLCEVLITCSTWISETSFRKSHLSVQVQRNIISLLLCLHSTSLFLQLLLSLCLLFKQAVTPHYAISSVASSFDPRAAEQQQEELEASWAAGWLAPRGDLWALGQPTRWSDCLALGGHVLPPGQGWPQLFCWACLDETFFRRCFGNQPQWHCKDVLPFKQIITGTQAVYRNRKSCPFCFSWRW